MKTIKVYSNRKLYDKETSAYVDLTKLAIYVANSIELRIIEHGTNADKTQEYIAKAIVELTVKGIINPKLEALTRVIQTAHLPLLMKYDTSELETNQSANTDAVDFLT